MHSSYHAPFRALRSVQNFSCGHAKGVGKLLPLNAFKSVGDVSVVQALSSKHFSGVGRALDQRSRI